MFAKLFSPGGNQFLVVIDATDEGSPLIKIQYQPTGMGICSVDLTYPNTQEGWHTAEKRFADMTEADAVAGAEAGFVSSGHKLPIHAKPSDQRSA